MSSRKQPARLPFLSTDLERLQSYYGDMDVTNLKRGVMRFNDDPHQVNTPLTVSFQPHTSFSLMTCICSTLLFAT